MGNMLDSIQVGMPQDIPEKYCNLKADKLIVWGEFWKKIIYYIILTNT